MQVQMESAKRQKAAWAHFEVMRERYHDARRAFIDALKSRDENAMMRTNHEATRAFNESDRAYRAYLGA
jgi:hypothetical protein